MFVLSYYLVFIYLIFGIKQLETKIILWKISVSISIIVLIISLAVIILACFWLFKWRKLPKNTFHIVSKENTSGETLNYILTILLTIISITDFSWNLLILLVLVYLIYISGELYYLQPLLMIFGYKVYKCKIEKDNTILVITKNHISNDKKYTLDELFDSTYILRDKNA